MDSLAPLAERLNAAISSSSRADIASAARDILDEVVSPQEAWVEQAGVVGAMVATRLFMKWGVFDMIPDEGGISNEDVAKKLDAEELLIRRIAAQLIASHVLRRVDDDHFAHTPRSLLYKSSSPFTYLFLLTFDATLPSYLKLPDFFTAYPLKSPTGPTHNPYTFARGAPESSCWELMSKDPETLRVSMGAMTFAETFMPMTGMYDYTWLESELGKDSERVALVDVGGGRGHAVGAICDENSWLPRERCVVQDRTEVVEKAKAENVENVRGVKFMAHDFNTEQPVKNAHIYHIRRCLHDYGDDICTAILSHLAEAMGPDSRLLVVEQVVGNPPSPMGAHFDLVMLTIGGRERTQRDFEGLAKAAGLKVVKIWGAAGAPVGVVECMKI